MQEHTHAHAHVRTLPAVPSTHKFLSLHFSVSISQSPHMSVHKPCPAWISRWYCCRQGRQCFLPCCPDTKQSVQEICRVSSKKHLQTANSLCWQLHSKQGKAFLEVRVFNELEGEGDLVDKKGSSQDHRKVLLRQLERLFISSIRS